MRTKLKQARTAKGFTVADVAARLNKSRSFYYNRLSAPLNLMEK